MSSLKHKYLASKPQKTVPIPGWGDVVIRSLSLGEMDKLKEAEKNDVEALRSYVLYGVGDEQGNRVFSDEDTASVLDIAWTIVVAIAKAVQDFNELSAKSVDDEKKTRKRPRPTLPTKALPHNRLHSR
jgi:hypothetical protein